MKAFISLLLMMGASATSGVWASPSPQIFKVETPKMPLVRAALYFPSGSGDEQKGDEGASLLLTRWIDAGTSKQSMMALGARVETLILPRFTLISVEAPSETFGQAWDLALDKIRHPLFSDQDLSSLRESLISSKRSRLNTWNVAGLEFATSVVYAGTKEAHSSVGTEEALRSISSDRLKDRYANIFAQGPAAILVSQSISPDQENAIRESTKGWASPLSLQMPAPKTQKGRRLIVVDRPGSTQTYLFFIKDGPRPGTEEHALTSIATQILGSNGGNSSLLFDELRAKRGLTYHASMQTMKAPHKAIIVGVTFGSNEKLAELAALYLKVWKDFYDKHDTPLETLEQADMAYRAMRDRESSETITDIINTAGLNYSITGDVKPIWVQPEITLPKFEAAKLKWLSPSDFTLVVLGDAAKIQTVVEKAIQNDRPTQVLPADADWDSVSEAALR